jgi:hypothetical protein
MFFSLQESLILLVIFSCFINVSLTSPSHMPWPVAGPRLKLSPLARSVRYQPFWGMGKQGATKKTPDFTKKTAGQYYF